MLTYQDCLGLCGLSQEEVDAVANHEGIPEMVAIEYAKYVIERPGGERRIRRIILDDIREAEASGRRLKAQMLREVLRHFIATHPEHRRHVA